MQEKENIEAEIVSLRKLLEFMAPLMKRRSLHRMHTDHNLSRSAQPHYYDMPILVAHKVA
jgi:hypothetical protein